MSVLDLLTLPENLVWAWRKAKKLYAMADGIYDQRKITEFDLNIEENLEIIKQEFLRGEYKLSHIRLLPQPKRPDENGNPRMRQSFEVSVKDQVAWIALVNARSEEHTSE